MTHDAATRTIAAAIDAAQVGVIDGEFAQAIIAEVQRRLGFDRPPQETYVRVSVERGPLSFEPGIEYREGDSYDSMAELLEGLAFAAATNEHGSAMDAARAFGENVKYLWPDRAWFVEVWKHGERGFVQMYQPFGIPRNR